MIISNINHFSTRWVSKRFPKIEQWAIWRDPMGILNSCIKNKFYGDWYNGALNEIICSIKSDAHLYTIFGEYLNFIEKSNEAIKTAFLIAVRNYFLFSVIQRNKIINYDVFRKNPNEALKYFLIFFRLDDSFDFSKCLDIDLNSIPSIDGYSKDKIAKNVINSDDMEVIQRLFLPLYIIYNQKTDDKIS